MSTSGFGRETTQAPPMTGVDAVVLVGGKGTRLRPLTLSAPKPMLPAAGVPFLAHLLSRIRDGGITHVILGTSYRSEVFTEYFGNGSAFGIELEYVVEDEPLDTGGAIRNVAGALREEHALIFNGDVLSGVDLRELVGAHVRTAADVTLHLVKVDDPRQFGSVPTGPDGRVSAFLEKTENPPTDQINAGCYVFRRSVLEGIPAGRPVSVERETFPRLLAEGARIFGYVDSSYWLDVGTPAAFVRGSSDLVRGLAPSRALAGAAADALVLDGARTAEDAEICGGSTVGRGCEVGPRAKVDAAVLFPGAVIEAGAEVRRSVIGAGARVGAGAVVCDAVIGDGAVIGERCELLNGLRLWPNVVLPDGGLRFSADA